MLGGSRFYHISAHSQLNMHDVNLDISPVMSLITFSLSFFFSHDINWASFCDHYLDDYRISMVRPEPAIPLTPSRSS
jgi:hypothetical protein